jgi:hypothetical protein
MALQIPIENPFLGISENAYLKVCGKKLDFYNKIGVVSVMIWHDESARAKNQPFGRINIEVGEEEVIDPEDDVLEVLGFSRAVEMSLSELYNLLKTCKVRYNRGVIDLSKSKDV